MFEIDSKMLCLNESCLFLSGALLSKLGDPAYFSFKKNVTFFLWEGWAQGQQIWYGTREIATTVEALSTRIILKGPRWFWYISFHKNYYLKGLSIRATEELEIVVNQLFK